MLRNYSKQSGEYMYLILKKKKEGLRWEGFAEKDIIRLVPFRYNVKYRTWISG